MTTVLEANMSIRMQKQQTNMTCIKHYT